MIFLLLMPYKTCMKTEKEAYKMLHWVNEKEWILVYFTISFLQVLRDKLNEKISKMFEDGRLTYRQKSRLRIGLVILTECLHAGWLVYGNVVYYK